jgi:hypothetical protein
MRADATSASWLFFVLCEAVAVSDGCTCITRKNLKKGLTPRVVLGLLTLGQPTNEK